MTRHTTQLTKSHVEVLHWCPTKSNVRETFSLKSMLKLKMLKISFSKRADGSMYFLSLLTLFKLVMNQLKLGKKFYKASTAFYDNCFSAFTQYYYYYFIEFFSSCNMISLC